MQTINNVAMITDRSASDVVAAKKLFAKGFENMTDDERKQFLSGLKGAYNYMDFNRVESAIDFLSNKISSSPSELFDLMSELVVENDEHFSLPYDAEKYAGMATKTNWSVGELIQSDELKRYISNILFILDCMHVDDSKIPRKVEGMDYNGANEIEKSLISLDDSLSKVIGQKKNLIESTSKAFFYSAELYGGEV